MVGLKTHNQTNHKDRRTVCNKLMRKVNFPDKTKRNEILTRPKRNKIKFGKQFCSAKRNEMKLRQRFCSTKRNENYDNRPKKLLKRNKTKHARVIS